MKTALLLGVHCHQPIDNFNYVIDDAIEKSYKPFFETLKKFPEFKISVHFSGSLLQYIQKNDSALFSLMQQLSNQIEFFTGGFYEPVLASIPSNDRVEQILKLNRYIKKHFKQTARGLWLTERVWDNSIIKDLKSCGIEYVIVDDYHLKSCGAKLETLNGYFNTEDSGETIALFPINQDLRYAIPFYSLEKTNTLLHSFANEDGKNAAVIFDDGEKFGIWPKTYETVYEKKWLEDFITQTLTDPNIETNTFKEYYEQNQPIALTYLPTVSYFEMGEWSLNSEEAKELESYIHNYPQTSKFLRGSTWKNFFTKYQESNWIHKRFLELSKKQPDEKKYLEALYKSQCNDVLWHGVFGGVYLPNLRDNAYKYIIECEKILGQSVDILDIDMDGYNEYKFLKKELLTIISPKQGGQIFELDLLEKNFNLQNTLTRYEESYHSKIENNTSEYEVVLEDELTTIHDNTLKVDQEIAFDYDWYFKKSAIDHIVPLDIDSEQFAKNSFIEYGDFANQPFEVLKATKKKLSLQRDGGIYDKEKFDTSLNKIYHFKKDKITIDLFIDTNSGNCFNYLHEWNLHFASLQSVTINGVKLNTDEQYSSLEIMSDKLVIQDSYLEKSFSFTLDGVEKIFISTLNSISQSEKGVDVTNQGLSIGFIYKLCGTLAQTIDFEVTKFSDTII
jgi:alpha-amylase/alpha-mannosidase (GH57 family)